MSGAPLLGEVTLASASPRRRVMLAAAGVVPQVRPVDAVEVPRPGEAPDAFAARMAREKVDAGLDARRAADPPWVVASDTVVTVDGLILGKPEDAADAAAMLRRLAGRPHAVLTAWAVAGPGGRRREGISRAEVTFRPLDEAEIAAYVATGEPMDKAGAYGIQGGAGLFVDALEGPYDTVTGLPVGDVCRALIDLGAVAPFPSALAERAAPLRARMAAACQAAGRDPAAVTLVAVGKGHPVEALRDALGAGLTDLGESYVQEWRGKAAALGDGPAWHFVGRLQRNKAKYVGGAVKLVHGVDDVRLGEALAAAGAKAGRPVEVLAQVNLELEETKGGVAPAALPTLLDGLRRVDGLRLRGLMTLPPEAGRAAARRCFARLRALRDAVAPDLPELSMGMSGDFEEGIAEGATLVRIGTALFGERPARP